MYNSEPECQLLLKCPETQRWIEKFISSKWPHINEEIPLGKILIGSKVKELGNLGALA
jgi:hypothetical protein